MRKLRWLVLTDHRRRGACAYLDQVNGRAAGAPKTLCALSYTIAAKGTFDLMNDFPLGRVISYANMDPSGPILIVPREPSMKIVLT